jgi:hypothetical protein
MTKPIVLSFRGCRAAFPPPPPPLVAFPPPLLSSSTLRACLSPPLLLPTSPQCLVRMVNGAVDPSQNGKAWQTLLAAS